MIAKGPMAALSENSPHFSDICVSDVEASSVDDALPQSGGHQRSVLVDREIRLQRLDMGADGVHRTSEDEGDFLRRLSRAHQRENFLFPFGNLSRHPLYMGFRLPDCSLLHRNPDAFTIGEKHRDPA